MIPNFCHIWSEQWQTGPSDLKVWGCWKKLAKSSCPWSRYSPAEQHQHSPHSQEQSPSGKLLQPWVYTRANTPCLFSPMSSGSSHTNSSSFSPVKGTITQRAAVLPGSRGGIQTLQMCQHKKSETPDHRDCCLAKYSLSSHSLLCKIISPCLKLFYLRKYFFLSKSISTEEDLRTLKALMPAININLGSYSVKHRLSLVIHLLKSMCHGQ